MLNPKANDVAGEYAARRHWGVVIARISVAIGLVAFLVSYFDYSEIVSRLLSIKAEHVIAALAVVSLQYFASWLRWHFILTIEDDSFSHRRSFSIYGIGSLANVALLTSIAGMSVRLALLLREKLEVSRLIAVVTVERLAAASGIVFWILLGLAFYPSFAGSRFVSPELSAVWLLLATSIALAALAGIAWRFPATKRALAEIRSSFFKPGIMAILILFSAFIVALGFAAVAMLARGMEVHIDFLFFIVAMPFVAFMASLPISIGGWGVREGSMVVSLAYFDVPPESALALSVAYGLAGTVVSSLFGSIATLIYIVVWRTRL